MLFRSLCGHPGRPWLTRSRRRCRIPHLLPLALVAQLRPMSSMLQHGCAPPSLPRLLSSCVKWMCEACLRRGTTDHGRMSLGGAARVMAGTQVVVTTLRLPPRRAATSSKNKPASAASLARPRESVPDAWTPRTVSPSARTRCAASPATSPATASVFVLGVVANRSLPPVRLPALVRRVGLRPSQPPQRSEERRVGKECLL